MIKFRHPIRITMGLLGTVSLLLFISTFTFNLLNNELKLQLLGKQYINDSNQTLTKPLFSPTPKVGVVSLSFQHDPSGFSNYQNYANFLTPTLIANLKESTQSFSCTPYYENTAVAEQQIPEFRPRDKNWNTEQTQILDQNTIPTFILDENKKLTEQTPPNRIYDFRVCQTNDLSTKTPFSFITYTVLKSGGGHAATVYFLGTETNTWDSPTPTLIDFSSLPYASCNEIFTVTNKKELYVFCTGGDGGYSVRTLYKIDFATNQATLLKTCKFETVSNEESKESCY